MVKQPLFAFLTKYRLVLILLIAFTVRLDVAWLQWYNVNFSIQQDNYADYAQAVINNSPSGIILADRRLFPLYPLLIAAITVFTQSTVISGITISLFSSLAVIGLFYLLTRNFWLTFLFSLFPPIWLELGVKVATEPLAVFLLLLSFYAFLQQKNLLAGIILGLAVDVRLISLALLPALLFQIFQTQQYRRPKPLMIGFFAGLLPWFLFNVRFWGVGIILLQFVTYPSIAQASFSFLTLPADILRTLDWGQYKILFSGLFYLAITATSFLSLLKLTAKTPVEKILTVWLAASLAFILLFSPKTLLDDFGRYTIPFLPATIYGLGKIYNHR